MITLYRNALFSLQVPYAWMVTVVIVPMPLGTVIIVFMEIFVQKMCKCAISNKLKL